MSNVQKIAVGKNNLVCGKAPSVNRGICAVEVVAEVFIREAEKSSRKINAARTAADVNIRKVKSEHRFVNINIKMKCGKLGNIVIVRIINVFSVTVFFKVNRGKLIKGYGIKSYGIPVDIGYKAAVIAD